MNKKILIFLTLMVLVVLAIVGFLLYEYIFQNNQTDIDFTEKTSPSNEVNSDAINENPNVDVGGIEVEYGDGKKGGLLICSDKCGDGICQDKNIICEDGNLNCVCIENITECPADCK